MADLVDVKAKWKGGNNTIFVQTGDVVDRGADTIRLYDMLQRLRNEAYKAGGQVVPLLGNHEVMNLIGDWRYVYPEDVETFGSFEARVKAFEADGFIGRYLTHLNMTAKVNRTIFCHGGIHPAFIHGQAGLDWINTYVHENLPEYMESKGKRGDEYGVFGGNGPTWYRGYALGPEEDECPLLEAALGLLDADRMVMGHTVQHDGKIHSRCDGKAILIDIGISKAYGRHRAALEIIGDKVVAINNGERVEIKTTEFFRDASRAFALLEEPMFNVARRNGFPSVSSLMRYPATDIRETHDAYILEAELPGIRKEDVDIEFQDNTLILRGKVDRNFQQGDKPPEADTATDSTDVVNSEAGETSVVQKDNTDKDLTPHWWSNKRITGTFSRSFSFPASVQTDTIKAAYKDGVLSITVPKAQKASSKINID